MRILPVIRLEETASWSIASGEASLVDAGGHSISSVQVRQLLFTGEVALDMRRAHYPSRGVLNALSESLPESRAIYSKSRESTCTHPFPGVRSERVHASRNKERSQWKIKLSTS
jgi:hypothetical protein